MAVDLGKVKRFAAQRASETVALVRASPATFVSRALLASAAAATLGAAAVAVWRRSTRRTRAAVASILLASGGARLLFLVARACVRAEPLSAKRLERVEVELAQAQGRVRGVVVGGVARFLGIPFAEPPTGDRRYEPPRPAAPWHTTLECSSQPPMAPQFTPGLPFLLGHPLSGVIDEAARHALNPNKSESCLFLNVFAPRATLARCDGGDGGDTTAAARKRPVMVYIHGGAFIGGAASDGFYSGAPLAAQEDVVVIVIQYRLGAFGYLHIDPIADPAAETCANLGVLDQLCALRWTQTHAAAFGGDAANITIFGESAGAMSCATLLAVPRARGLFRRAILQSGAASTTLTGECLHVTFFTLQFVRIPSHNTF